MARQDDTLVVHSMDRLARNLDDLRLIVQKLTLRGIIHLPRRQGGEYGSSFGS